MSIWLSQTFATINNETMEFYAILNELKDPQGIVIDLGVKDSEIAIALSADFYHTIAVESNFDSSINLKKRMAEEKCSNITLCNNLVSDKSRVFSLDNQVHSSNQSLVIWDGCALLNENEVLSDFFQSITFKQLIFDYIFSDEILSSHPISLIKCDVEEDEETILEDLLHFAYNNKCPVYFSFHLSNWQSRKIEDFEYLFAYFETNCPAEDVCKYLIEHPSSSILFKPKKNAAVLFKKEMPVIIIGYNQLTFIRKMVEQLEKYTSDIIVVDNASTYPPLLEWYKNEFRYTLLRQRKNFGHGVYRSESIQKLAGEVYILTDPDLLFNPCLPDSFIQELVEISNYFKSCKVGFALLIDSDDIRNDVLFAGHTIKQWESQFWVNKLFYPLKPNLELYSADIDTTFCLINKRFSNSPIRIGGQYTCIHIPWMKGFEHLLGDGEYASYLQNNISTNWFKVKGK